MVLPINESMAVRCARVRLRQSSSQSTQKLAGPVLSKPECPGTNFSGRKDLRLLLDPDTTTGDRARGYQDAVKLHHRGHLDLPSVDLLYSEARFALTPLHATVDRQTHWLITAIRKQNPAANFKALLAPEFISDGRVITAVLICSYPGIEPPVDAP
jgi:hypothetical protein